MPVSASFSFCRMLQLQPSRISTGTDGQIWSARFPFRPFHFELGSVFFFCMDDNSLTHIHGFLIPQLIWLKPGIGGKKKKKLNKQGASKCFLADFRFMEAAPQPALDMGPCVSRARSGAGGRASSWRRNSPCAGVFFQFLFFTNGEGGALRFTRRNDASQPRLHPAPPQRNRLFGKIRVWVSEWGKSLCSFNQLNPFTDRVNSSYLRHNRCLQ